MDDRRRESKIENMKSEDHLDPTTNGKVRQDRRELEAWLGFAEGT
jgi:hypothetical protein